MIRALEIEAFLKKLLFLFLVFSFTLVPANAAGLLANCDDLQSSSCFPTYKKSFRYRLDLGDFGDLSSSEVNQVTNEALDIWNSVPTSSLEFIQDSPGHLDEDINTGDEFLELFESTEELGFSPIIFDKDSRMIEELLGSNSRLSVIGFAGARVINRNNKEIVESIAMFNDHFFDSEKQNKPKEQLIVNYKAVTLHEGGHMVGLDHSQTHVDALNGNDSKSVPNTPNNFQSHVPILFPFAVNDTFNLQKDDISSISRAYPTGSFNNNFGTIKGKVIDWNSKALLGVNITAYRVDDPFNKAVSSASDIFGKNNGEFELKGLESGRYVLRLERINSNFRGSSSVGPHDPNTSSAITEGYYIEEDGSLVSLFAEAVAKGAIPVSAGTTVSGITIKMFDHGSSINDPASTVFDHSQAAIYEIPAAIQASDDKDYFKVILNRASNISFTSTGDVSLLARLLDSRGIEIANNEDDGVFRNFAIFEELGAGEYFVEVSGAFDSSVGVYNIRSALDDHGNNIASSSSVNLVAGNSIFQDLFLPSKNDIDFFKINVPAGGLASIETVGNLDTVGVLYDSSGKKIVKSESGSEGLNFLISKVLNQGVYFLSVEAKGSYGDIKLRIHLSSSNSSGSATFSDATGSNAEQDVSLRNRKTVVTMPMKKINGGRSRKLKLRLSVPREFKRLVRLPYRGIKRVGRRRDDFMVKVRLAKSAKFRRRFPNAEQVQIPVLMKDTNTGYELTKVLNVDIN